MNETEPLDRKRIEALVEQILLPIRANYLKGPMPNRDRAYEALNALAAAAGLVLRGCDGDDPKGEAYQWFQQALDTQRFGQLS